ncbi:MAG: class I SAM-dependent methyltransferase [Thermoanaerobaculia bacterium]
MTAGANYTRRSASIPERLRSEGRGHLVPLYRLLRLSDLAREGIERSGSFRFADHIYIGRPRGRYLVGTILDAVLLALPAARSFRNRMRHVEREVRAVVAAKPEARVASIPSGIPRDLLAVARTTEGGTFTSIDLDPEPLAIGRALAEEAGVASRFRWIERDVLDGDAVPGEFDAICSTGLVEFLPDDMAVRFLAACRAALAPNGILITSATRRHRASSWLMETFAELEAHYRDEEAIGAILDAAGFSWSAARDAVGWQVLLTARPLYPSASGR